MQFFGIARAASQHRRIFAAGAFFRDAETTILIKFAFWRGLGRGKIYGKLSQNAVLFLRNSMTIKLGNFTNLIVRNFVVIWEAPISGAE